MTLLQLAAEDLLMASEQVISDVAASLEDLSAAEIVQWAFDCFGGRLCVTTSMADSVMVHLATSVTPDIEVVFLDTGFHFAQTIETLERVTKRFSLNLRVERPVEGAPDRFTTDIDTCCGARKVDTLNRALAGKQAWMTGLRRADSPERALTPIVSRDKRGLVKVCPIARWSDADVEAYIAKHRLIVNPLLFDGYASIGCEPCTQRVHEGDDARAGRWAGTEKTECGIHQ